MISLLRGGSDCRNSAAGRVLGRVGTQDFTKLERHRQAVLLRLFVLMFRMFVFYSPPWLLTDFVTVRASTFNANQLLSTRSVQQIQYQSITNHEFQRISITC